MRFKFHLGHIRSGRGVGSASEGQCSHHHSSFSFHLYIICAYTCAHIDKYMCVCVCILVCGRAGVHIHTLDNFAVEKRRCIEFHLSFKKVTPFSVLHGDDAQDVRDRTSKASKAVSDERCSLRCVRLFPCPHHPSGPRAASHHHQHGRKRFSQNLLPRRHTHSKSESALTRHSLSSEYIPHAHPPPDPDGPRFQQAFWPALPFASEPGPGGGSLSQHESRGPTTTLRLPLPLLRLFHGPLLTASRVLFFNYVFIKVCKIYPCLIYPPVQIDADPCIITLPRKKLFISS